MVVDVTQLRSVLTGVQVFDCATGFAAHVPRRARVALVVRPDQLQDAGLVVKITQADGVFLTHFLDPEKAVLWVKQTEDPCGQKAKQHLRLERQVAK